MTIAQLRRLALALPVVLALVGCTDQAGVKQETTYKTPEGSTTVTKETKVETEGDVPPPTTTTTPGTGSQP
jgi:hypothetical protein